MTAASGGHYVEIVTTYCGAGCDFIGACQEFRWAGEQFDAFPFKVSKCKGMGRRTRVTSFNAIDPAGPGPYLAVSGPKAVRGSDRPWQGAGPVAFDVYAYNYRTPAQGVRCVLPPGRWQLCMRNVHLFLLTSEATRDYPQTRARLVLQHIAQALRYRNP